MKTMACSGAGLLARVSLQTSLLRFHGVPIDNPRNTVKFLERNGKAVTSATSLLKVSGTQNTCERVQDSSHGVGVEEMVFLHLELKGIVSTSSQVVALIDTLTNYVLSAHERVHKRISLYIRINGNDAMSQLRKCTDALPRPYYLIVVTTHLHMPVFAGTVTHTTQCP